MDPNRSSYVLMYSTVIGPNGYLGSSWVLMLCNVSL